MPRKYRKSKRSKRKYARRSRAKKYNCGRTSRRRRNPMKPAYIVAYYPGNLSGYVKDVVEARSGAEAKKKVERRLGKKLVKGKHPTKSRLQLVYVEKF